MLFLFSPDGKGNRKGWREEVEGSGSLGLGMMGIRETQSSGTSVLRLTGRRFQGLCWTEEWELRRRSSLNAYIGLYKYRVKEERRRLCKRKTRGTKSRSDSDADLADVDMHGLDRRVAVKQTKTSANEYTPPTAKSKLTAESHTPPTPSQSRSA